MSGFALVGGIVALVIGIILFFCGLIALLFAALMRNKKNVTWSLKVMAAGGLALLVSFSLCSIGAAI